MDDACKSMRPTDGSKSSAWRAVLGWFDATATAHEADDVTRDRVDWARILPFVGMHAACLAVLSSCSASANSSRWTARMVNEQKRINSRERPTKT